MNEERVERTYHSKRRSSWQCKKKRQAGGERGGRERERGREEEKARQANFRSGLGSQDSGHSSEEASALPLGSVQPHFSEWTSRPPPHCNGRRGYAKLLLPVAVPTHNLSCAARSVSQTGITANGWKKDRVRERERENKIPQTPQQNHKKGLEKRRTVEVKP